MGAKPIQDFNVGSPPMPPLMAGNLVRYSPSIRRVSIIVPSLLTWTETVKASYHGRKLIQESFSSMEERRHVTPTDMGSSPIMIPKIIREETMKVFYENFASAEDVFREFDVSKEEQAGVEFIYADYNTPAYEGDAFVVFVRDGRLYEVNGSHCSCNGLEGCWQPEETSPVALLSRPNVSDNAKTNIKHFYRNLLVFC
jgi:hypothetical protein